MSPAMAAEPLLAGSSTVRRRRTLSLASTLSLLAAAAAAVLVVAVALFSPSLLRSSSPPPTKILTPPELCAKSPNPTSCAAIISGLLPSATSPAAAALRAVLEESSRRLRAASAAVGAAAVNGEGAAAAALADCSLLLELSAGRISSSVGGEAATFLSAALTNYDTCVDGLDAAGGGVPAGVRKHIESLVELGSASLAVLAASSMPPPAEETFSVAAKIENYLPEWLSPRDRRMLDEVAPAANAVVAKDGSGKFSTVQAAVDSAPSNAKGRYVIYVKKGVYKETVRIGSNKKNLMIVGDGASATVITGSLNVVDGATTFNSATLAAEGDGLILQDLKVENTAGAAKHQAVALRVTGDTAVVNRCSIDGYQDTLYAHSLRQFYRDTTVSGTVDYIFGNAAVVLQNCTLVARRPMDNQQNLVTAQGRTDPNQNTGTSVQGCRVVPSADLSPAKGKIRSYLGRPWKEYSRTVVMESYIDDHIVEKGWLEWDGEFGLKTLFYGEYMNKGPGAGTARRVTWPGFQVITDPKKAQPFTVAGLIQGGSWLPATGVAFTEGL